MAEKAYPDKLTTCARGNRFNSGSLQRQGYIAGANAVLEEIEKIVQYNKGDDNRPWLLRGNHLYNEITKKINELKGE